ncbi:MAG: hypothetical protein HKO53_16150, partial [Gemmatimonadetes bacterium]|nr:hypothetical protein [Gemmatimonadota bacterium]
MRSTGFPTSVLALAGLLLLGGPLSAQQGRITGRVLDAKTALPIASAQVFLEDQSVGTLSSIDGRYVLRDVPVGVQTVIVQMIGYGQKTITGVEVTDGGVGALDSSLEGSAVDIAGITVAATVESGSTSALLYERRSEAVVVDAIGS